MPSINCTSNNFGALQQQLFSLLWQLFFFVKNAFAREYSVLLPFCDKGVRNNFWGCFWTETNIENRKGKKRACQMEKATMTKAVFNTQALLCHGKQQFFMGSFYDHIMFNLIVLERRIIGNISFFSKQKISTVDIGCNFEGRRNLIWIGAKIP